MSDGKETKQAELAGQSGSELEATELAPAGKSVWAISRRDFFKATGSASLASMFGVACGPAVPDADFETTLVRPDDLVFLRFQFINLELVGQASPATCASRAR